MDFQLPGFNYFQEGNTWTGSKTKDRERELMIRMKVAPDKDNGALVCDLWRNSDVSFEKAQDKEHREFPLKAESLALLEEWFTEEYNAL